MKTEKTARPFALVYLLLACILGGIIGSVVTLLVLSPEVFSNTQQVAGGVTQTIYSGQTIQMENRITGLFDENKESVVFINSVIYTQTIFGIAQSEASGSGFIVSDDGYIVTNDHVVADATNITVTLATGEEFKATIRGADPLNDVAVIKINPSKTLRPVVIGDSDNVRAGEFVVAIGSPFRLQNTVTLGIVSALNRTLESEGGFVIEKVIQTDAAVNPGNSGGPLLSLDGKVIGINTAIISQSGGSEGIGFSIPINTVKKIYTEIIESGKVKRPWLGITGSDVTSEMVRVWDLKVDYGVVIVDFADNSPAKKAGLVETMSRPGKPDFVLGDIIVRIAGQKIEDNGGLLNVLLKYKPGDTVEVEVYRDGEFVKANVALGERPEGL
ncbi:MAG: trypsin-like peptidase domain-containing protein [Candidatus Aenigmarchaeota archaeon]|nr:trypsin-like peptidase domain-containing protein [Candidatus Aenigmarchaeota archaeon]